MFLLKSLYSIVILPIESLYEFIFNIFSNTSNKTSIITAIFALSILVNLLTIPLYNIAEKIQKKQKIIEKKLQPGIKRIKHAFKGDEQIMILSTFYKQNHYSPLSAFKNSLTILIEIPFFIAAFHFLSNLDALRNVSFFAISDLSKADSLIHFSIHSKTFCINLLPVLMTLINLISGIIYSKDSDIKDKIQIFGISIIFLFLLYNSPSGLVIYWIFNNIFSLVKNIINKHTENNINKEFVKETSSKNIFLILLISGLTLALLYGFLTPSQIIKSSPIEFTYLGNTKNPLSYITQSFMVFFGSFVFWPISIFLLASKRKTRKIISFSLFSILIFSVFNIYLLKVDFPQIDTSFILSSPEILKNKILLYFSLSIIFLTVIIIFLWFLNKKRKNLWLCYTSSIILLAVISLGSINIISIKKQLKGYTGKNTDVDISKEAEISIEKKYNLTSSGKNVIVIFLDRAINSFFPKILEETPSLRNSFNGFKYYPNTLSFSDHTIMATPAMFGGYEYTPEKINELDKVTILEKYNESLLVMPKLFLDAGYSVTVSNPPFSSETISRNFNSTLKTEEIKNVNNFGKYTQKFFKEKNIADNSSTYYMEANCYKQIRNFSLMEGLFPPFRYLFYKTNIASTRRIDYKFWNYYSSLYYLNDLTDFTNKNNTFLFVGNDITHEPYILNDDYTLNEKETTTEEEHYFVNKMALTKIADFFDYLKENDAYDNSRIIIVSDHGFNLKIDNIKNFDDSTLPGTFNPLLLFKDFNSSENIKTDNQFMTNADLLFLATQDLNLSNLNPLTGKVLQQEKDFPITVHKTISKELNAFIMNKNNTFTFRKENTWQVSGYIFDGNNWKQ